MNVPAAIGAFGALVRRHAVFAAMLAVGIAVRVLFVVAYRPAFWFSDSPTYVREATQVEQTSVHGPMYSAFLHMMSWTGQDVWIAVVQHTLIVGVSCALYAVLVRRNLPRWLAAFACSPLLLGGQEIVLEHYILTEAVFTTLTIAGIVLLLSAERPRTVVYGISGLLLGLAALGRTTALIMAGVALLAVLLRRVGWRRAAAFAVAAVLPLVANTLFWKPATWTDYDLRHGPERYLYSRLAQFADCSKLPLTVQERTLCPPDPLGHRSDRGDHYLFNPFLEDRPASDNALIASFDQTVILHQLPDYLRLIALDTSRFLVPGQSMGPGTACLAGNWYAPRTIRTPIPSDSCEALLAQRTGFGGAVHMDGQGAHPGLRVFLSRYSHYVTVPVAVNGLCVLLVAAVLVRRRKSPLVAESALALGVALSAIVASMALAMYDPRFGIPVAVLFTVAGAMAGHALSVRAPSPAPSTSARDSGPVPAVAAAPKEAE